MIFKRKIYQNLLEFKKENGRVSLLIEGARRIGKTTIVEEFAKNEYASYIFVDFQADGAKARRPFKELPDLDAFFRSLMLNYGKELIPRNSLIVFDEVQNYPKARERLKQLVADGRYDYIATGSLISIRKNVKDILIPSEQVTIQMHPMDFEEFCWATGNSLRFSYVRECFEEKKPLLQSAHQAMMKLFRTYLAVGGMPDAVSDFVEARSFQAIDRTKRTIIKLYESDLAKLDDDTGYRCSEIMKMVPNELASHNRAFRKSTQIFKNDSRLKWGSFGAIEDSRIFNVCRQVDAPSIDFNLYAGNKGSKIYMGDTGLLVSMIYRDSNVPIADGIYRGLVANKLSTNDGMLFENAVAQEFVSSGRELYYYSFSDKDKHRFEIDFLLRKGKKIVPIEVKSASSTRHSSLDAAVQKYSRVMIDPVILCSRNYSKDGIYTYMPVYMAGLLAEKL